MVQEKRVTQTTDVRHAVRVSVLRVRGPWTFKVYHDLLPTLRVDWNRVGCRGLLGHLTELQARQALFRPSVNVMLNLLPPRSAEDEHSGLFGAPVSA